MYAKTFFFGTMIS